MPSKKKLIIVKHFTYLVKLINETIILFKDYYKYKSDEDIYTFWDFHDFTEEVCSNIKGFPLHEVRYYIDDIMGEKFSNAIYLSRWDIDASEKIVYEWFKNTDRLPSAMFKNEEEWATDILKKYKHMIRDNELTVQQLAKHLKIEDYEDLYS
jgi:hypothetical protein